MFTLSDIIMFVTALLGVTFMLMISALAVFIVNVDIEGSVIGDVLYDDPLTGNMLLTFTELTDGGVRVRDILTYSVWYGAENITINNTKHSLSKISPEFMNKITDQPYRLVLETHKGDFTLASYGEVKGKKSASMMITADSRKGRLTLWRD